MTRSRQLNIEVEESFPHLPMAPVVEAVIHWQARPQAAIEPAWTSGAGRDHEEPEREAAPQADFEAEI